MDKAIAEAEELTRQQWDGGLDLDLERESKKVGLIRMTPDVAPIGTRWLCKHNEGHADSVYEIEVMEWSPSGKRVKVKYLGAAGMWLEKMPLLIEKLPTEAADFKE